MAGAGRSGWSLRCLSRLRLPRGADLGTSVCRSALALSTNGRGTGRHNRRKNGLRRLRLRPTQQPGLQRSRSPTTPRSGTVSSEHPRPRDAATKHAANQQPFAPTLWRADAQEGGKGAADRHCRCISRELRDGRHADGQGAPLSIFFSGRLYSLSHTTHSLAPHNRPPTSSNTIARSA